MTPDTPPMTPSGSDAVVEIQHGPRFPFGENWSRFLRLLTKARIAEAEDSLRATLNVEGLSGKSFLDIGCGSGLFSLAARRLGARVHSFDYDPQSVACARELRRRYFPDDEEWTIEEGSALDGAYMSTLGRFDVVYCWGVLHHTGQMWDALEHVIGAVGSGGRMWIAIYNHQPLLTPWWRWVKRGYLRMPSWLQRVYVLPFFGYAVLAGLSADLLRGKDPRRRYAGRDRRGMSPWHDAVDWVGGWPFETATPAAVVAFVNARGLESLTVKAVGRRHGCNEFVFQRPAAVVDRQFPSRG